MLEEATPQLLYSSDNHGYALKRLYEQLEVANGTGQPSPHRATLLPPLSRNKPISVWPPSRNGRMRCRWLQG